MPVIRRTKKSMVNGVLFKIICMFRHCAFWTNWSPLPIMIKWEIDTSRFKKRAIPSWIKLSVLPLLISMVLPRFFIFPLILNIFGLLWPSIPCMLILWISSEVFSPSKSWPVSSGEIILWPKENKLLPFVLVA